jgi:uncharacterized protein YjeT (DUF2065 family)
MIWVVLAIAYLAIAVCLVILAAPQALRRINDFLSIGSRLYAAGAVRIIFGILLLMLASRARFWAYVVMMGLLASAAGISLFFIPLRRTKKLLQRVQDQSNPKLRLFAAIGLVLWALLVYSFLPVSL